MQKLFTKYSSHKFTFMLIMAFICLPFCNRAAFFSFKSFEKLYVENEISQMYKELNDSNLAFEAWQNGLTGYLKLIHDNRVEKPRYLTIVDFSQPSSSKRLYVVDMVDKRIVFQSLCSHGRNSGGLMAHSFSNTVSSYQSSLGFYLTADTYSGKFDYAMRLDGLEFSNSNARERAIVVHGAQYATEDFLRTNNGILGRSLGCPALPIDVATEFINLVKDGSCFFIYAPSKLYQTHSKLINYSLNINDLIALDCLATNTHNSF